MSVDWGAGHVIMGRYRLESILGSGGMGSVWKAEHLQLKTHVAVKLLDPAIAKDEQVVARFIREARSTAALRNRHVVQIFDYGVEDDNAFIVMEMLQGETLGARIEKLGTLPVDDTVKFMCQVMRAMGRAHEIGIIHRDLKPENIFLCTDDEGEYAKVLDFGVAKVGAGALEHSAGVKTQTGMMIGTPFYMSPEQAKAKVVDHRADIWALAVITYEALTGKRPFNGQSFADLVINVCSMPIPLPSRIAAVPKGFDEWFVHGTQRDVDKRFKSTRDMANELMQLAGSALVGRRSSSEELGPATVAGAGAPAVAVRPVVAARAVVAAAGVGVAGAAERNSGAQRSASARPPAGRGSEGARLDLTTGQRASTGYDASGIAQGRTKYLFGGLAAVVLVAAAVGFAVLRPRAETLSVVPEPAAQPQVEAPSAAAPEAPRAVAPAVVQPTPSSEPAPSASAATPTPEPKVADKKPAADVKKSVEKEKPAPAEPNTNGSRVPVVDKSSLPPKDWNF